MGISILLVDDDTHILETAQDILEAAGYEVQSAETGSAALQKLEERAFHLMIIDFNLADTTGCELAIKAKILRPDVVIVIMTGESELDLEPAKSSIYAVLTKPVHPDDLLNIIKQTTH
jgi:two-component system response regulator HydG